MNFSIFFVVKNKKNLHCMKILSRRFFVLSLVFWFFFWRGVSILGFRLFLFFVFYFAMLSMPHEVWYTNQSGDKFYFFIFFPQRQETSFFFHFLVSFFSKKYLFLTEQIQSKKVEISDFTPNFEKINFFVKMREEWLLKMVWNDFDLKMVTGF